MPKCQSVKESIDESKVESTRKFLCLNEVIAGKICWTSFIISCQCPPGSVASLCQVPQSRQSADYANEPRRACCFGRLSRPVWVIPANVCDVPGGWVGTYDRSGLIACDGDISPPPSPLTILRLPAVTGSKGLKDDFNETDAIMVFDISCRRFQIWSLQMFEFSSN